jgi:uncharacterized protein (DUF934 family)
MSVIVTDAGFGPDTYTGDARLELGSDTVTSELGDQLTGVDLVVVDFPSFADGRGFSIARHLRLQGYTGRLRAKGHVLADQYAMARRSGFDEVEISDDLAQRQPEDQWQARADWKAHNYQARLRGGASAA